MKIFLMSSIFFLPFPLLLHAASISHQQKDEMRVRLERVQSLLHSIKPSPGKPVPKLLSPGELSRSVTVPIPKSINPQGQPAAKPRLKEKFGKLQSRINRAEALLRSIKGNVREFTPDLLPPSDEFVDKDPSSPLPVPEPIHQPTPGFSSKESKYNHFEERINRADALLKSLGQQGNAKSGKVPEDKLEDVPAVVSSGIDSFPLEQKIENPVTQGERDLDSDPSYSDIHEGEESSYQEIFIHDSSHEIRFQLSYAYPFSSTFITARGEGVPLEYEPGVQGEVQYLYTFASLALGGSILWSEQDHERLGPLQYTGYVSSKGETRSFGGSLLAGLSADLSDRFSIDSILSLGLVRRLDKYQINDVYFSEAGVSFLYSLSLGINMKVTDSYKIGVFGKYQEMNGLTRNSKSENFQLGASLGLEF